MPRHPLYALFSLTFIFILRLTFLSTFQRSLIFIGGAKRDRTVDLLLAKQALSQLSYSPIMVGLNGLEPSTSRLSGVRSHQLSYRPVYPTNKRELISQNYIRRVSFVLLLRKEVIHPHVLVGIPCYDLTPIICPTLDGSLLAVRPPASGITNSHGLTGSVYKARERIHRDILIRDY